MNKFLMLVGVAVVAGAMYVAGASGSQQAKAPTAKQFNALKKQVATLSKSVKTVKAGANFADGYILTCLASVSGSTITVHLMGVSQFGTSASGFLFGNTTSSTPRTALDVNTTNPTYVLQGFDPTCLSGSALRHAAVHSGLSHLHVSMANTR